MKKILFMLIAANGALSTIAQTTAPARRVPFFTDSTLSRWAVDVNLLGGVLTQNYTLVNSALNYPNAISTKIGNVEFKNGMTYGASAQLGYFFDRMGHFGVSTGFMYLMQRGDLTLSNFRAEYKGSDANGDFRQIVTATKPIKEKIEITNLNIPVMLKYKTRFSKRWGFTADAGVLFNVRTKNKYTTDASFDYEAAVRHVTDVYGNMYTVYDNGRNLSNTDLVITRDQYTRTNPGGDVDAYFADQQRLGYNVGLGVSPTSTTGSVKYTDWSVGLMAQPSISYYLTDKVSLNLGAYYIYQSLDRNPGSGTMLTNKLGEYNSSLTNVSNTLAHSYGGVLGVRVQFGKLRDRDHDGVPDKLDKCPDVPGSLKFNGCPDRDNDGVPDAEDQCPDVFGLVQFKGCPDSDGDGIPDERDACPYQPGPSRSNGCPDSDGDGVSDADDRCPSVPGMIAYQGCPAPVDTTPRRVYYEPPTRPGRDLSEPILFETGKTAIKESSIPILLEAIMEMNNNENAFISIDGHTDNVGGDHINDPLSFKRANAVRKYLVDMGANPKRMVATGHGSRQPIAPNTTPAGRAMNRRVIMTLKNRPKDQ